MNVALHRCLVEAGVDDEPRAKGVDLLPRQPEAFQRGPRLAVQVRHPRGTHGVQGATDRPEAGDALQHGRLLAQALPGTLEERIGGRREVGWGERIAAPGLHLDRFHRVPRGVEDLQILRPLQLHVESRDRRIGQQPVKRVEMLQARPLPAKHGRFIAVQACNGRDAARVGGVGSNVFANNRCDGSARVDRTSCAISPCRTKTATRSSVPPPVDEYLKKPIDPAALTTNAPLFRTRRGMLSEKPEVTKARNDTAASGSCIDAGDVGRRSGKRGKW